MLEIWQKRPGNRRIYGGKVQFSRFILKYFERKRRRRRSASFFAFKGRTLAAARRGGYVDPLNEKPPENRVKTAIQGFFLMEGTKRTGIGPLGFTPEVTAEDQEGEASRPVMIV